MEDRNTELYSHFSPRRHPILWMLAFMSVFFVTVFIAAKMVSHPDTTMSSEQIVQETKTVTQTLPPSPVTGTVNPNDVPPTVVYPATNLLTLLEDLPSDELGTAVMNSADNVLSVPLFSASRTDPSSTVTRFLTARYLDQQTSDFLAVFSERNIPVVAAEEVGVGAGRSSRTFGVFASVSMFLIIGLLALWLVGYALTRKNKEKDGDGKKSQVGTLSKGTGVTFEDVAGLDEAVEQVQEIADYLKHPARYTKTGAKRPKGVLLSGPPGTGKTLLARALADEANLPFYYTCASDFVNTYVGKGAANIREVFADARKHPDGAIIFVDEVDAIATRRSTGGDQGGSSEHIHALNALLSEMDGFRKDNVFVLGATNRENMLDEAVKRPGRFTKTVVVSLPDRRGREQILAVHVKGKPVSPKVDLGYVAGRTSGMSGADLGEIVNEACMEAARRNRETVTEKDFDYAVEATAMGKERTSAVVSERDRAITAWHEAGHTLVAMVLPDANDPVSVSIIPRGPAGGVTWMSEKDNAFMTRREAYARLVVAMGGRAGEEALLDGEFTSGPASDLEMATSIAWRMVTQFAMTDEGLMVKPEQLLVSGSKVTDSTVEHVEALLSEALVAARATIASHRVLFDKVVERLLEQDTLAVDELKELYAQYALDGDGKDVAVFPPTPSGIRVVKTYGGDVLGAEVTPASPPAQWVTAPRRGWHKLLSRMGKEGQHSRKAKGVT